MAFGQVPVILFAIQENDCSKSSYLRLHWLALGTHVLPCIWIRSTQMYFRILYITYFLVFLGVKDAEQNLDTLNPVLEATYLMESISQMCDSIYGAFGIYLRTKPTETLENNSTYL